MKKKELPVVEATLESIVGGGQTIATMDSGCKLFVWGGLPGEEVSVQITKKKSKLAEGIVMSVHKKSPERIEPRDADSYLSTSPWQIMDFDSEQRYKASLIESAYKLHNVKLPNEIAVFSDNKQFGYRNKLEFSWYWNKDTDTLDLAFFRRGTHGKIPVGGSSLAMPAINKAAIKLRDLLRQKPDVMASMLKTLIVRCDQFGNVAMQLYVKEPGFAPLNDDEIKELGVNGFELIYSNPNSPASVISKRLQQWGKTNLTDKVLDIPFNYAVESFFQINIPVYEQALIDIKKWAVSDSPVIDLYSGVGTIGLTIGASDVTLVEVNESAVAEMQGNIKSLGLEKTVKAILAPSEKVLDMINGESTIIVDPPRAGMHESVVDRLIEVLPKRIIYLSCNPVTQARDVAKLLEKYQILYHQGYNFFPRTPHIEHLVVLEISDK